MGNILVTKATVPGSSQPFNFSLFAPGSWHFVNNPSYNGGLSTTPLDMGLNELGLSALQWVTILQGQFFGGIGTPGYPPFVNVQFSSTTGTLTPIPGSPVFQLVSAFGTYGPPPGGTEYADLSGNTTHTPTGSNPPTSNVTGAVTVFAWIPAGAFSFSSFNLLTLVFRWTPGAVIQNFSLLNGQTHDSGALAAGTYAVTEDPVTGWTTSSSSNPGAIVVGAGTTAITFTNTHGQPACVPFDADGNLPNGVFVQDLGLFIGPSTALYTVPVPGSSLAAYETTTEGRVAIVLDFNQGGGLYARDLGTVFSWPLPSGTVLDVWQPSIIPMPEGVYGRASDWIDGGLAGDKFVQGITIEADSFGNTKTFQLQSSDDMSMHPLNEMPANFNGQSVKSFSCTPFISHSVRVVNTDGVEWRVWSEKLVFEPYPSSCLLWSNELMNYGNGWQHVRMLNVPYIASAPVTIALFFDQWPMITITDQLPATSSQLYPTKTKVQVPPNKSKLMGFTLSSTAPFRVFKTQLEVWVGPWGRVGAYETVMPFGGPASDGATV